MKTLDWSLFALKYPIYRLLKRNLEGAKHFLVLCAKYELTRFSVVALHYWAYMLVGKDKGKGLESNPWPPKQLTANPLAAVKSAAETCWQSTTTEASPDFWPVLLINVRRKLVEAKMTDRSGQIDTYDVSPIWTMVDNLLTAFVRWWTNLITIESF